LGAGDEAGAAIVKGLAENELMLNGGAATLLAMQYEDPSFESGVALSHMSPLTEYEKISCHILVHWTRKTGNGIVRTDFPYFTGSGFFIDPKHVLTAYHVIEPVFDDSTVSWGMEIRKDGANHTVETRESFGIPSNIIGLFGDSGSLAPGSDIYCLGDPQGFESTWTKGIVSAVSRRAPEIGTWMQIDAAVSSGASGGLVLGGDGKIYGMVIAGYFARDINFAVPSNTLLARIDGLLGGKNARFPWLGLLMESDFEITGRLVIADIFPSSPLKGTSLRPGDTVLELNGTAVKTVPDAQAIINAVPLGSIVRVKASNAALGRDVEYYAQLPGRPEYAMYNATQDFNQLAALYPYFGFKIDDKNLTRMQVPYKGQILNIPIYKVLDVKKGSILDRFGVKSEDQIGILADYTVDMTRYIDVIHLPKDAKDLKNMEDMTIELEKDATDENIL
jgi:hypothetical protein